MSGFHPINQAKLTRIAAKGSDDRYLSAEVFDEVLGKWRERRFGWDEVHQAAAWVADQLAVLEM